MAAEENHSADSAARQAALHSHISQTPDGSLLPIKLIKDSLLQFQQTATKEEKRL